jgi:histidinol dehydrogenase
MGALAELGPAVAHLARMEGFEGHARSMEIRNGARASKRKKRA